MTEYKPPVHPWITVDEKHGLNGFIFIKADGHEWQFAVDAEQAFTLGLALMETGLYLKSLRKKQEPTE